MKRRFGGLMFLVFSCALLWGITALARDIFKPLVSKGDRYSLKVRVVMRKGAPPAVDVSGREEEESGLPKVRVLAVEADKVRFVVDDVLCEVVMEE